MKTSRKPAFLRIRFLVIAFSLFLITLVLGLSAYLTDVTTYYGTFRTATGSDLGFEVAGTAYDDTSVLPGSTVSLDAMAKVSGNTPLYVFVKVDLPAAFTVNGFNSTSWHPISEGSTVYYYGTKDHLSSLDSTNRTALILSGITLSSAEQAGQTYALTITGYAIQKDNIPAGSTPQAVFDMIGAT